MYIIVYNPYYSHAAYDASRMIEKLTKYFGTSHMKVKHHMMTIDIFDTRIDFRAGDLDRMAGVRPDYYCAWNQNAITFLNYRGGKRLGSLDDIVKVIYEHYNKIEEKPTNETSRP